jgi:tRNA-modifying protein YgfZ
VVSDAERLADGSAFVDASSLRATGVSGPDARAWLNDLMSADLSGLGPGLALPSLLLGPTGGIRAAFTVIADGDGFVLLQDPGQDRPVGELLAIYVLSSDVVMTDRTGELAILAFPGLAEPPAIEGARPSAPSVLGAGSDLLAPSGERERIVTELVERYARATAEDAEAWRIAVGVPRVGVDTADGDLPQEAALEASVAFDKGCFVGQEAVAKTRNLGHPRRTLLPFAADGRVAAGETVVSDAGDAGLVTSAVPVGDGTRGLARIRWADRDQRLRTAQGVALEPTR